MGNILNRETPLLISFSSFIDFFFREIRSEDVTDEVKEELLKASGTQQHKEQSKIMKVKL